MGMGKGQSSTTVQMTPEQRELLGAQTKFLTETAFPAYQQTVGGAQQVYGQVVPPSVQAAQTAMDVSQRAGALQESGGAQSYVQGIQGLQNLFGPQYERQQIQAALQPATEDVREQMAQQATLFGGAGGLGSARQGLASQNLASLAQARLGNIAAQTAANVAGQRQQAATTLLGTGQQSLQAAQQAAAARIGYAQTPQDIYGKYASVVFGVPQASTTPNFAGTQGQTTSGMSKGFGGRIGGGGSVFS